MALPMAGAAILAALKGMGAKGALKTGLTAAGLSTIPMLFGDQSVPEGIGQVAGAFPVGAISALAGGRIGRRYGPYGTAIGATTLGTLGALGGGRAGAATGRALTGESEDPMLAQMKRDAEAELQIAARQYEVLGPARLEQAAAAQQLQFRQMREEAQIAAEMQRRQAMSELLLSRQSQQQGLMQAIFG